MSKVKRGTAGEYIFKAKALLADFNVFAEDNQDSKCDCIIQKEGQIFRIQIKLINPQNQLPVRKLTHSKTRHTQTWYSKREVDYMVGVKLDTFDAYIVPIKVINECTSTIHISKIEQYKNNFNLQEPYIGNYISADLQVGESCGNANAELGSVEPSVETLRDPPKERKFYGEDKVQNLSKSVRLTYALKSFI